MPLIGQCNPCLNLIKEPKMQFLLYLNFIYPFYFPHFLSNQKTAKRKFNYQHSIINLQFFLFSISNVCVCVCVGLQSLQPKIMKKEEVKTYISFHIFKFQAKRESKFREVLHIYLIWCAPTEDDRWSWRHCTQCWCND